MRKNISFATFIATNTCDQEITGFFIHAVLI